MTHHDRPEDHPSGDHSADGYDSDTGDPGTDRTSVADLPPEDVAGHPSQAEGEDPDSPADGDDGATGHPSQAEGEDPDLRV